MVERVSDGVGRQTPRKETTTPLVGGVTLPDTGDAPVDIRGRDVLVVLRCPHDGLPSSPNPPP